MLSKTIISKGKPTIENSDDSVLKIGVSRIKMADYEIHHYFKEKIKEVALPFGEIQTTTCMDLDQVRKLIDKIQENNVQDRSTASGGWCFVDAVTAGRFFRIGNAVRVFREINFNLIFQIEPKRLCITFWTFVTDQHCSSLMKKMMKKKRCLQFKLSFLKLSSRMKLMKLPKALQAVKRSHPIVPLQGIVLQILSYDLTKKIIFFSAKRSNPNISSGILEKTTEGVLKAARLGDLRMLTELHHQGYSLLSIDETGKTALHYGARFGHKEVIR